MTKTELRFRQIHLDFHTSECVEGIGAKFDPDEFAGTLDRARVNSVTTFARCHHGWLYYDSKLFPERVHPHLARKDLLPDQIAACHKRGIRVPIYITVQWDHFSAEAHPEWLIVGADGTLGHGRAENIYAPDFYRFLCVNSPYAQFLQEMTKEVLQSMPVDGIFFDIVQAVDCSCTHCRGDMLTAGLDPSDADQRRQFARRVIEAFTSEMTAFVRQYNKDCTLFYNSGHIGPAHRQWAKAFTHWELESLPSGGWGYMHFPLTQHFARTTGKDCLGMTGKFHTSWGDFHSFKNPQALQFECFNMLALNAKCSVGDQLPPNGKICQATYDLIGSVYRQVEAKEPWCRSAKALAEIGVLTPEEFQGTSHHGGLPEAGMGAVRMLQELRHQFDVLDSQSDLAAYRLLILPDEVPVAGKLGEKIDAFLAGGGKVLATYKSGLAPAGDAFALKALGVKLLGEAPFSPDFIVPTDKIGSSLPRTEHVMYLRGLEIAPRGGAKVLAHAKVPYFERTWRHFCSHRHTPSAGKVGYPAVVRTSRSVYFAHPVFAQYAANAPRWCKVLVADAIDLLLGEPLVRVAGPTTLQAALNEQAKDKRWVLHLLHYIPERRGREFDIIEDVIPLLDLACSIRADRDIAEVRTAPQGQPLPFASKAGRVEFTLPRLDGHQMIELRWGG
jgi:hypothetical protein